VHETYLRLVDLGRVKWQNRAHFFAIAGRLMRQVLVDHARERAAAKRGGSICRVPLTENAATVEPRDVDLLDLDAALGRLANVDRRLSDLVVLRFFGGLSIEEAAEEYELSEATVKRAWSRARAWLYRELWPDGDEKAQLRVPQVRR